MMVTGDGDVHGKERCIEEEGGRRKVMMVVAHDDDDGYNKEE